MLFHSVLKGLFVNTLLSNEQITVCQIMSESIFGEQSLGSKICALNFVLKSSRDGSRFISTR